MLIFEWVRCDPSSGLACKNDTEIDSWLADKEFAIQVNNERFENHQFGNKKIVQESHLIFTPMSSRTVVERSYDIQITNVQL